MSDIKKPNLGRHRRHCSICAHPQRLEIEGDFIAWRSPAVIAEGYGLADRASVYRHAHALGLFAKRQRNVRAALERIIEKADEVEVTASAVVAAVQAYAKINAAGHWIDRSETVNLNELFDRMSTEELESYARDGNLPGWFTDSVAGKKEAAASNDESPGIYQRLFATLRDSREAENMEKDTEKSRLPATSAGSRPGDLPLRSLESRAAARATALEREDSEPLIFQSRFVNGSQEPEVIYDYVTGLPLSPETRLPLCPETKPANMQNESAAPQADYTQNESATPQADLSWLDDYELIITPRAIARFP